MGKVDTVVIRWKESAQWKEMSISPSWTPRTREEKVSFAARRMMWTGCPRVEAYVRATKVAA